MNLVDCKCGCGQRRSEFDNRGRRCFYIKGHGQKTFVRGNTYGRSNKGIGLDRHPRWKGGKSITSSGYVSVALGNKKRRLEHDLVMENFLGRNLMSGERVHHINGDKTDNRIENLRLMLNGVHTSHHHKGKIVSDETRARLSEATKRYYVTLRQSPPL